MQEVDAIIIGTGQGGVPLAVDLAAQGKHVVVFERDRPGGSCINHGCTPTKAFLAAAHAAGRARQSESMGIYCDVHVDFAKVMDRVRKIRNRFMGGIVNRLDRNGIQVIHSEASFTVEGLVHGNQQTFSAPLIVINTGSRAMIPYIEGLRDTPYLTDDNFWDLHTLPQTTAVIGGGYIGLELGQGLARLGSEVHIFVRGERILSSESPNVSAAVSVPMKQEGINFHHHTSVNRVSYNNGKFTLEYDSQSQEVDSLLVATGRTPNTESLKPEAAGIKLDDHGYIRVNERFETTRQGVYAIGEVARQPAFTHVAWEDYRRLQSIINGGNRYRNDRVLGYAVFTEPQVGRAGLNEEQAQNNGYETITAQMDLKSMSRAIEWGYEDGFFRIIADQQSRRILGAELVGYETAELVNLFIDLIEKEVTLDELAQWQHIHPTYAENFPSLARMALSS